MLCSLAAHQQGGIDTPNKKGFNKPLFAVFLRPIKTLQAGLIRLTLCYGGLCGALARVAVPFFGSINPTQSATQRLIPLHGGLNPRKKGMPQ